MKHAVLHADNFYDYIFFNIDIAEELECMQIF